MVFLGGVGGAMNNNSKNSGGGLLGPSPAAWDGNKRKRDAENQYVASMIQGNPKILLAQAPIFRGFSQQTLPFSLSSIGSALDPQYEARIRLPLPDGSEAWGMGVARTKKEAQRVAAVDSCKKLHNLGLLVGDNRNSSSDTPWGDNPKNILAASVAFRQICSVGKAGALPLTVRSSGPDHAKVFVAELAVPLNGGEVYLAVGQGRNKAEAERACCVAACEKLHGHGLLTLPDKQSLSLEKALQIQQQNEQPPVVGLRDEELVMMENALQRLHLEMQQMPAICQPEVSSAVPNEDSQLRDAISNFETFRKHQVTAENSILHLEARSRTCSPEFAEQRRQARQALPAWLARQEIIDTVHYNRVVVLTGETGCGKTTQVPQFILEEAELQGRGAEVHIVVTQPRRIAAISVAERVAWERGEMIGKSVGYTIRLESTPPRLYGSIHYCTTGILLRRLQKADGLAGVSHVIIDEVHERDLDTDFLLIVVRELLQHHLSLRVVIMSATLDASILTRYFGGCPVVSIPGMIHPVDVYFLEDLPKLMGQHYAPIAKLPQPSVSDDDIDVELVSYVISWVADVFAKGDGAILCFLTGWDSIAVVRDQLLKMPASRSMMIVPLHSHLPAGEQRAAFSRAPAGICKVVLATNIAETSVTIDDIVYVVDAGMVKENQFDASRNMTALHVQWTSKASARQRQGRAGRVRSGFCFRLYTQSIFAAMSEHQIPEMQRVPLEELCLQIKAIAAPTAVAEAATNGNTTGYPTGTNSAYSTISDIATFLSKALQPPKLSAVHVAIKVLQDLGAIDGLQNLTPLGKTLVTLAVHPRFGKMLIYGALLGCVDALLTIASAACFRDPFVAPVSKREVADKVRESFATGLAYGSDHLALANAYEQWSVANSLGRGYYFCENNFLAPATMKLIAGTRRQFERTLADAGLLQPWSKISREASAHVARSLLVAGLYPNIAQSQLCKESKGIKNARKHAYRWRLGFKIPALRVFIHPTSVISEKQLNPESRYYVVFHEKVQTSQTFIRGCTLVSPLALVLFGWNVCIRPDVALTQVSGDWMLLEVGGWLRFLIDRKAGVLLLQLRCAFDSILTRWVSGNKCTDAERYVVDVVVTLLAATCHDMFVS